jgi:hypothetical protein
MPQTDTSEKNSEEQNAAFFICNACQHIFKAPNNKYTLPCPSCNNAVLTLYSGQGSGVKPESMVPFSLTENSLTNILSAFTSGVWLAVDELRTDILQKRLTPIFWPMWMVDCEVQDEWQAEMGFDYKVKSSKEHYTGSTWQSEDVIETRVRWEPRLGTLGRAYHNTAVPAINTHDTRIRQIGSYDYVRALSFDSRSVGKVWLEESNIDQQVAWQQAETQIKQRASKDCQLACEAQHIRNFSIEASFEKKNWTYLYLPMYATWYKSDEGKPQRILINGQSGKIYGKRLASPKKGKRWAGIQAIIAVGLLLLSGFFFMMRRFESLLGSVAGFLFFIGMLLLVTALIPLIRPVQWNRKQEENYRIFT